MKKNIRIYTLLISIVVFSCKENPRQIPPDREKTITTEIEVPKVKSEELITDFMTWWTYFSNNITLSSDFIGLNEKSQIIDKKIFLEQLVTSKYIPIKLESVNDFERYKLYKLGDSADKSIKSTIGSEARTHLFYYNMIGKPFPKFDIKDLKGNHLTNESTLGKIIVFKTWFINCVACVAEFPELNELVDRYENDDDILFVSLALDSKVELEPFLEKKPFNYRVVADQEDLIKNRLKLSIYPTHIIVDEAGTIKKVVNKASEMISFLNI